MGYAGAGPLLSVFGTPELRMLVSPSERAAPPVLVTVRATRTQLPTHPFDGVSDIAATSDTGEDVGSVSEAAPQVALPVTAFVPVAVAVNRADPFPVTPYVQVKVTCAPA